jgi:hypothetical protein
MSNGDKKRANKTIKKTAINVLLRTFVDDDDQPFPFFLSFFIIVSADSVVDALCEKVFCLFKQ